MPHQVNQNQSNFFSLVVRSKAVVLRLFAPLIIALIANLAALAATAAELVVISSTGSDFEAGQIVESSTDINLANDATLTLISESGKIFALKGPRSGVLKVEGTAASNSTGGLIPSLKKIISGEKTETGSLGVMRSVGGSALPDDSWAIIAGKSGKYCVSRALSVVLWRPNSQNTSKLTLLNVKTGKEVRTVWHAGKKTLYWPRLQPLVDGATYRVDLTGESKLPKLTIAIVPKLPTLAHSAVWMVKNGCEKQALRLLKSLK